MVVLVIGRTMTALYRAAVLRRIRLDGGLTGETLQIKYLYYYSCDMGRTIQCKVRIQIFFNSKKCYYLTDSSSAGGFKNQHFKAICLQIASHLTLCTIFPPTDVMLQTLTGSSTAKGSTRASMTMVWCGEPGKAFGILLGIPP